MFWAFALFAWIVLIMKDFEPEPPLFNLQDRGGGNTGGAYYCCYRYPRPEYWIGKLRDWLESYRPQEPT